jgi:outer membrane biosynthesis protein TonB
MVELRKPPIKRVKTAKFVYSSDNIPEAVYIGTYDDNGLQVIKSIKGEPERLLAAFNEEKNRMGFPTENDTITAHPIDIRGETKYWFSYIPAKDQEKEDKKKETAEKKKETAEIKEEEKKPEIVEEEKKPETEGAKPEIPVHSRSRKS